jgi:hypothetical protein
MSPIGPIRRNTFRLAFSPALIRARRARAPSPRKFHTLLAPRPLLITIRRNPKNDGLPARGVYRPDKA